MNLTQARIGLKITYEWRVKSTLSHPRLKGKRNSNKNQYNQGATVRAQRGWLGEQETAGGDTRGRYVNMANMHYYDM